MLRRLASDGYTPHGAIKQLHLLAHLSRWLDGEGLGPGDLDGDVIGRFFADRREAGHSKLLTPRAAEPMLAHLRGAGGGATRAATEVKGTGG